MMHAYSDSTAIDTRSVVPLDSMPEVHCALVSCGTSRIAVFDGRDLPAPPERELAALMIGAPLAHGLGGEHYQLNKAVLIWPGPNAAAFSFRFFQIDRHTGSAQPDLECANAAAGAAVLAVLRGATSLGESGIVEAYNAGTGQRILLHPHDLRFWQCSWDVRFVLEQGAMQRRFSGSEPLSLVGSTGAFVPFWVIEQGNVFVLADVSRVGVESELIARLEDAGRAVAARLGADPERGSSPKVLTYSVHAVDADGVHASVRCFYRGEQHASLPGSAAMCLGSFFAGWHLDQVQTPLSHGELTSVLHHPSGSLPVRVHWMRQDGTTWLRATEFSTPVRLLMHGRALRPGEPQS